MGARSRKRRDEAAAPRPPRKPSAVRDAEVRATLEPLAAGERPGPVTAAAIISAVLALANLGLAASGYELSDEDSGGPAGGLLFAVILLAMAVGLWRARYWAVLGFQALLALTLIFSFLGLLVASNVLAVVLCVTVLGGGSYLFYRLVRAMARIQMPQRRPT
jgi:hypothetical protein